MVRCRGVEGAMPSEAWEKRQRQGRYTKTGDRINYILNMYNDNRMLRSEEWRWKLQTHATK